MPSPYGSYSIMFRSLKKLLLRLCFGSNRLVQNYHCAENSAIKRRNGSFVPRNEKLVTMSIYSDLNIKFLAHLRLLTNLDFIDYGY